jgi:sensor histidine kinase YesM
MIADMIVKWFAIALSCCVETIIIVDFMEKMYSPRYKQKAVRNIVCFGIIILWFFIINFQIPILNALCMIIIILFLGLTLYTAKNKTAILFNLILAIAFILGDALISSFTAIITDKTIMASVKDSYHLLFNVIIIQSLYIVLYKIIMSFIKGYVSDFIKWKQFAVLLIVPIFNITLVYVIIVLANQSDNKHALINDDIIIILVSLILLLISIFVIYFFEYIAKANKLENDLKLIGQQTQMQYNYYNQLEVKYEQSQKIMHDVNNHMKIIEQLYKSNNNDEGLAYTQIMFCKIKELGMTFRCQSKILTIIINDKMQLCRLKGIEFKCETEDMDLSFIDNIDITTLFANLLDNAIEACLQIAKGEKWIDLKLYSFNEMIVIDIINTTDKIPIKNNNKIRSSKKNHTGVGLSNIESIVNKYEGDLDIEILQNQFRVSIMVQSHTKIY